MKANANAPIIAHDYAQHWHGKPSCLNLNLYAYFIIWCQTLYVRVDKIRNQSNINYYVLDVVLEPIPMRHIWPSSNDACHILNLSAALKFLRSLSSGINRRINRVLLGRIVSARKVDSGRDRQCDVTNDVSFSLYLTPTTSNVRYVSIYTPNTGKIYIYTIPYTATLRWYDRCVCLDNCAF